MKGYSTTEVVAIIVAVVIAVFILYIAWSKGLLPFSQGATEAQCKAYLSQDCQNAVNAGWENLDAIFSNAKGCKSYVSKQDAFVCCVGLDPTKCPSGSPTARADACRDMCSEFIGG